MSIESNKKELLIGSHVSMSGKEMLLGSVKEALNYQATTFMFYTGAPQNTYRKKIEELRIEEAKALMQEHNIDISTVVVHAPYIINLANTINESIFELAVEFLEKEIRRVEAIGATILVLHPGSHVKAGEEIGLQQIINGLNLVLKEDMKITIALETMAGKGSEVGHNLSQLKTIIDGVTHQHLLGVCIDTCHMHDAGYDITSFDAILEEFDQTIGLERLKVVHVNDSKNVKGARKDRHANIGYGEIGFDALNYIIHHPKLENIPKILETPYVGEQAPYGIEIEMFRNQEFNAWIEE